MKENSEADFKSATEQTAEKKTLYRDLWLSNERSR